MSAGDWKELFKAAREGNLELIRGRLRNGVDPNYQHPEYFSSPVFEAIRSGQLQALTLLLEYGGSSTRKEESTDKTPLEVAMSEGHHDIVDFLISKLEAKDIRPFCKRIAIAGKDIPMQTVKEIFCKLLEQGHQVVIVRDCIVESKIDVAALANELWQQTKNEKVEVLSTVKELSQIDTMIIFATSPNVEEDLKEIMRISTEDPSCRSVILFNGQSSDAVATIMESRASSFAAMEIYDTWLSYVTKFFWKEKWLNSVAWIATEKDNIDVCGKVHTYDAYHQVLADTALF
jgi:hypothetical protein